MNEPSSASEQLAVLAELHALLDRHGIAYWLFGGWAVDFHVGRVTRAHDDLDIAAWWADRDRLATLLTNEGWLHTAEVGEDGYAVYARGGVRLEVAFLARDDRGCAYTPLRDGRGEWPAESFGDELAELHGVQARVIGRGSLIADKSVVRDDARTAAKDDADLAILLHRR
jgi:hypothetical protein